MSEEKCYYTFARSMSAMKLCLLAILIHSTYEQVSATRLRYHENFGIPAARRIKERENQHLSGSRIFNGNDVILGQHPYFGGLIVILNTELLSVCGSTLISKTALVTAAHCWSDGVDHAERLEVVLGSITLFSGGTRIRTDQVTTHEDYDPNIVRQDIALITIPPITYSAYIQPARLPGVLDTFDGLAAKVIGFGKTSDTQDLSVDQGLRAVNVTILKSMLCRFIYRDFFSESMICTDGIAGGACSGDSGGPLIHVNKNTEAIVIGVVSYGSASGCEVGFPTVYTKTSDYIKWIADHTSKQNYS